MNLLEKATVTAAAAWLRHSPIRHGRWRVIAQALPILRRHGRCLGNRLVRTRHGFLFNADLGDWLGQYVYLTGTYEPPTARVIQGLLRPGDRFADIGANAGFFTLHAALAVGASGRVFSFEPLPAMRARLQLNVELNAFRNVLLYDFAVADREGKLTFFEGPEGHKGISSLREIENPASKFQVRTRPLDSLAAQVAPLRMVKIDVEGAEHRVLLGMQRIIESQRPYLLLEITDAFLRPFGSDAISLAHDVVRRGYRMYAITEAGLKQMTPEDAADDRQYNALFAPETPPAPLLAFKDVPSSHP